MVPADQLEGAKQKFDEIITKFSPLEGNLHITELQPPDQETLRNDVYEAIRTSRLPCFWYAVHVAGFHRRYIEHKNLIDKARANRQSHIKPGGHGPLPSSLHVELFSGLYGNLVAFCEEREQHCLEIEVRTDNVDGPVAKAFGEAANKLLDFSPTTRTKTGFDTKTKDVVKGSISVSARVSDEFSIAAKVKKLDINCVGEGDGLVLAADVLANSLAYLFHHRTDDQCFRALNTRQAVATHPLAKHLDSFWNWGNFDLADTFYRHPRDPELAEK